MKAEEPVSDDRWRRLRPLLEQALTLPESERAGFVCALGGEDATLRDDLARLIDAARTTSAADPVARLLAPETLAQLLERADAADARIGQSLGAYRLVRVLGRGGMGTVYLAERTDGAFGQRVALKVIEGSSLRGAPRERFERERQILAMLRHPAIASLFDGGETRDGLPYYTMELVEGATIAEYCREVPSVRGRVELLLQVAAALAYAHQRLIVHRDIKPGNVLVAAGGHVKLLDFGIAKLLGEEQGSGMTQATVGPMTRDFAAPEQFRGGEITVATDVFQFGTLCYRLLTGRLPYRADPHDAYAWARAVSEDDPLPPERALGDGRAADWNAHQLARVRRQLRGDLGAILRKALAKSPADRYGSIDAMSADLRACLEGRPVSARRAGAAYYAWRVLARRPYVSIGAALALAALIATTLFAWQQAGIARQEAERARNETARASSINEFLVGLFRVADPGVNRGEKLTANQVLERGATQIAAQFAAQPEQRARLEIVIAEVYANLGDWSMAQRLFGSAIDTLRADPALDRLLLGRALRLYGLNLYKLAGDAAGSMQALEEGVRTLEPLRSQDAVQELELTRARILLLHSNGGELEKASAEMAQLARHMDDATATPLTRASVYALESPLLQRTGRIDDARRQAEFTLAEFERAYGKDDWRTLIVEGDLAIIYARLQRMDDAYRLAADVPPRQLRIFGTTNLTYENSIAVLGDIERIMGKDADARRHLGEALDILARTPGKFDQRRAQLLIALGTTDTHLHDDRAAAEHFGAVLALELPPRTSEKPRAEMLRAEAMLRLGETDAALALARAATQHAAEIGPDNTLTPLALRTAARAEAQAGDVEAAAAHMRAALASAHRIYEPNDADLATVLEACTSLRTERQLPIDCR